MIERLAPAYLRRLCDGAGRGDLVPADRAGEAGSYADGTAVRVTLRLDPGAPPRVAQARFRALASAAPWAPGSVLVERVRGLGLDAAGRLAPSDLLAGLGETPPAVGQAAVRLCEALRAAADDGVAAARTSAPGVLVCRCISVGDRQVRRAVRAGAADVPAIGLDCGAGTGCHSCWPDLRALLHETLAEGATDSASARPAIAAPTPVDAARAVVAPLWRAQGVALGRVEIRGGTVLLEAARIESEGLASPLAALALARHALREVLDPEVRVVPLA